MHNPPPRSTDTARHNADKLPHERDETTDTDTPPPEPAMVKASADVAHGMVDTDRGNAVNITYKKQKTPV